MKKHILFMETENYIPPILSILIPSIPERKDQLSKLLFELNTQIDLIYPSNANYYIEVLVDDTISFLNGGLSIGKKREQLVGRATGRHLTFLDDDESVAPNYMSTLIQLCEENKDICTFKA